jgi:hypothetical protein
MTRIYLELGTKKVFACCLDWPGWCRIAKDEQSAIDRLMAYAPRYRVIAERTGLAFEPTDPVVVAQVKGGDMTDFGVPYEVPELDLQPFDEATAQREVALLRTAWQVFDEVAAVAPEELRKGPRGGGRDLAKIVHHVEDSERAYARKVGVKHRPLKSRADRETMRAELAEVLSRAWQPPLETGWPPSYARRRLVWHVIDHLWEIEDRR